MRLDIYHIWNKYRRLSRHSHRCHSIAYGALQHASPPGGIIVLGSIPDSTQREGRECRPYKNCRRRSIGYFPASTDIPLRHNHDCSCRPINNQQHYSHPNHVCRRNISSRAHNMEKSDRCCHKFWRYSMANTAKCRHRRRRQRHTTWRRAAVYSKQHSFRFISRHLPPSHNEILIHNNDEMDVSCVLFALYALHPTATGRHQFRSGAL